MGSMLSQQYITRYGESIDALVLWGSPGFKTKLVSLLSMNLANSQHEVANMECHPLLQRERRKPILLASSSSAEA